MSHKECSCRTIINYYCCCCYFDFLIELIMPEKLHVCPSKIVKKLRISPEDDATVWNDKKTSCSLVYEKCLPAFFYLVVMLEVSILIQKETFFIPS